jgi:hypothetical protein
VIVADGVGIGDGIEPVERGFVAKLRRTAQQQQRAFDSCQFFGCEYLEPARLQFGKIGRAEIKRDELAAAIAEAVTIGVDPVALVVGGALVLALAAGQDPLAGVIVEIACAIVNVAAVVVDVVIAAIIVSPTGCAVIIVVASASASCTVVIVVASASCAVVIVVASASCTVVIVVASASCAVIIVTASGCAIVIVAATGRAVVVACVIAARAIVIARVVSADIIAAGILIVGVRDIGIVVVIVIVIVIVVIARVLRGERLWQQYHRRAKHEASHQQKRDDDPQLHRMPPFTPSAKSVGTGLVPLAWKIRIWLFYYSIVLSMSGILPLAEPLSP